MVAMEFGSCFVINNVVRLDQVVKCLYLISQRNVDFIGLKDTPCRKAAGLSFIFWEDRALWVRCCWDVGEVDIFDENGISHRPLSQFMWPKTIRLLYLIIFMWYLKKMAIQPPSHILPMEMRSIVVRLSIIWNSWVVADSSGVSGTCIERAAWILLPYDAFMEGQLEEVRRDFQDKAWWHDI